MIKKAVRSVAAAVAGAVALCSLPSQAVAFETIDEAEARLLGGAVGGDEIRRIDNGDGTVDLVHIFTNTVTSKLIFQANNFLKPDSMSILLVGGGGSGSSNCGGGGGAGGLIYTNNLTIGANEITVKVGDGGAAPADSNTVGNSGDDSTLEFGSLSLTALGGGTGGKWNATNGVAGGSGGGACGGGTVGAANQPSSDWGGFGNAGGKGADGNKGGGGGGAGGAGGAATTSVGGTGGKGLTYNISGEDIVYAAGGGGGGVNSIKGGAGGSSGVGGDGAPTNSDNGGAGRENTGSGGGGGTGGGGNSIAGAGGSGVAIIRYTVTPTEAMKNPTDAMKELATTSFTGAEMQWLENSNELVLKFTDTDSVGTIALTNAVEAWVLAVGGGGAGANPGGATTSQGGAGGGGAGGFVEKESVVLTSGTYRVTVGAGGVSPDSQGAGGNGSPSYVQFGGVDVAGLRALGGGGGGIAAATSFPAGSGGSGGGGSKALNGGSGTDGQGNAGGNGKNINRSGAGGGGAGGVGTNTVSITRGGAGGIGKVSYITGSDSEVWYAGGGGGGSRTGNGGAGGAGGGGAGGGGVDSAPVKAESGTNGTGGGGGGGRLNGKGGNGGSGVVIVRIRCLMPEKPKNKIESWTDSEIVAFPHSDYYIIKEKDTGTVVEQAAATEVGTYTWTAKPVDPYVWRDGTQNEVEFFLTINAPQLQLRKFEIIGWQLGEEPNEPELELVKESNPDGDPINPPGVTNWWGLASAGLNGAIRPWGSFEGGAYPDAEGEYLIKAIVPNSSQYSAPTNVPWTTFKVWEYSEPQFETAGIDEQLGFHVDAEVPADANIVRITFSENNPNNPLGFRYRDALPDGSDVRFTDDNGNLLAFVKDWNPNDVSVFQVKAPATGSIHIWWGLKEGTSYEDLEDPGSSIGGGTPVDPSAVTPTYQEPNVTLENHWVVKPSLKKYEWDVNTAVSADIIIDGIPAYDNDTYDWFVRWPDGDRKEFPTAAGNYEIVFTVAGGKAPNGTKSWTALSWTISFSIITSSPTDDLSGTAGSATLSGRVLILEDYGTEIKGQKYSDWNHLNADKLSDKFATTGNTGSSHLLCAADGIDELCGSTNIWQLIDVYIGNNYSTTASEAERNLRNLLPHASASAANAANLMMRNLENAAVYSPCYSNGIGTIYFDAVNGWTKEAETGGYKIVLEVIRGDAAIVDDVTDITDSDAWTPVEMTALKRVGDGAFDSPFTTKELTLDITTGGSDNKSFYRVYAPLDCREPIRFRIRRTAKTSTYDENSGGFILLDNIIASYPAMFAELSPIGWYDPEKTGKLTLGMENAWSVPFPAAGETVYPRAKAKFYTNPGNTNANISAFITGATLKYRWRYLDQKTDEWQSVSLKSATDVLGAVNPITLPKHVGDIEFYYQMRLNAPFYKYKDYTVTSGEGLGVPNYSENKAERVDDLGWFIRTREGKSDYEKFTVVVRESDPDEDTEDGEPPAVQEIPMDLFSDHNWRGSMRTPTNKLSAVWFQIRGGNLQTPGSTDKSVNTNYWTVGESCSAPVSTTAAKSNENKWTKLPRDGITGYVLFQFNENTEAFNLVHADYQNFGGWDDASRGVFVGTNTEPSDETLIGSVSGVSAEKQTFIESFSGWGDMDAEYSDWIFPYISWTNMTNMGNHESYKWFSSDTSGAWDVGSGRWVSKLYCDDTAGTGVAFQMAGQGAGYAELVGDKSDMPRGIESLSFNARVAQGIDWSDISYYLSDRPYASMSNYCFTAGATFDRRGNDKFRGNASLSLVSNYRPGIGCYEFRVEQYKAKNGSIDPNSQRLSLYRWRNGTCKLLRTDISNKGNIPTTADKYTPMFICVTNEANAVVIACGVGCIDGNNTNNAVTASELMPSEGKYTTLFFRDKDKERLKTGTFGVLSANSYGTFVRPTCYENPCKADPADPSTKEISDSEMTKANGSFTRKMIFSGTPSDLEIRTMNEREDEDNCWYTQYGRMTTFHESGSVWGLQGTNLTQTVNVYTSTSATSEDKWKLLESYVVNDFGSTSSSAQTGVSLKPYSTDTCSIRIVTGGTIEDARTDVVIDSLNIRQFAGESFTTIGESKGNDRTIPTNRRGDASDMHVLSNFVFTTGWIKDEGILLSAKRTPSGKPASIRSPLMDGGGDNPDIAKRGIGLGMFSFAYSNAQENVRLLLQVATNNVSFATIKSIDNLNADTWTTVATFDFSNATDRISGVRSHYLGMHGVEGVMRLVMDPNIDVSNVTDTNKFAEILITDVLCRDEPDLDERCWWGWNLRTVGADSRNQDSESRMYIADLNQRGEDGTQSGKSLALNDSMTKGIDPNEPSASYKEHVPFVQTPTFATNVVGEISFKARRWLYTNEEDSNAVALNTKPAVVTLYGASKGTKNDQDWDSLAVFKVESDIYTTFSYKNAGNETYKAFRLAVSLAESEGEEPTNQKMPRDETAYNWRTYTPVRVLLDEILVTEAIQPRVGFKNVGAFRCRADSNNSMYDRKTVTDVPSRLEQPLVDEEWGVQCEIERSMLPDEVFWDLTDEKYRPSVTLYWFSGRDPWGYQNWKQYAKSSQLAMTSDSTETNLVFRSTSNPTSMGVIEAATRASTVQYMLEVVYHRRERNGNAWKVVTTPTTNYLSSAEWQVPEWYRPIDYNSGRDEFSAFCILDTVAPSWAWINEVNVFGDYINGSNTDEDYQYIEIAAPADADLTGWKVNLITPVPENNMIDGHIITNTLATFGSYNGPAAKKPGNMNEASNMVFRVLANKAASRSGRLKESDGTLDGVWSVTNPTDALHSSGEINFIYPFGVQLIRSSGIIEHEIMSLGTNFFSSYDQSIQHKYNVSNNAEFLNRRMANSQFFVAGVDDAGEPCSLGVYTSAGENAECWNNIMTRTPGRINEGQYINPKMPRPNGTSMFISCLLDEFGHIKQTVGDASSTTNKVVIRIPKGDPVGTNITYAVDKWYELESVTTNGVPMAADDLAGDIARAVGKGCSNDVVVVAKARVKESVENLGLLPKYRDAVMQWLTDGTDAYGNPFRYDTEQISQAEFHSRSNPEVCKCKLSLTEMYWFDMDPTIGSNLWLFAETTDGPNIVRRNEYGGYTDLDNLKIKVFFMITNTLDHTAYAPYVMRSQHPGMTSWNYEDRSDSFSQSNWDSVTFKPAVMINLNTNRNNWVALRWFVFGKNSFTDETAAEPFTAEIEMWDPKKPISPGYWSGIKDWPNLDIETSGSGSAGMFLRWSIDDNIKPYEVEILKPDSTYDNIFSPTP